MTILNVSDIINLWVENKLNLSQIKNDVFTKPDGDAVILRYDPAASAERRFNDGTRLIKWNLTYYVRNKDREKARQIADKITKLLDGESITDTKSGVKIDVEALTLPQFISTDEKNNTIYSAGITASYLDPRDE